MSLELGPACFVRPETLHPRSEVQLKLGGQGLVHCSDLGGLAIVLQSCLATLHATLRLHPHVPLCQPPLWACILQLRQSVAGHYVVVFDPLDGSSNIDAGISVGSIFGIYAPSEDCNIEVRLPKRNQAPLSLGLHCHAMHGCAVTACRFSGACSACSQAADQGGSMPRKFQAQASHTLVCYDAHVTWRYDVLAPASRQLLNFQPKHNHLIAGRTAGAGHGQPREDDGELHHQRLPARQQPAVRRVLPVQLSHQLCAHHRQGHHGLHLRLHGGRVHHVPPQYQGLPCSP